MPGFHAQTRNFTGPGLGLLPFCVPRAQCGTSHVTGYRKANGMKTRLVSRKEEMLERRRLVKASHLLEGTIRLKTFFFGVNSMESCCGYLWNHQADLEDDSCASLLEPQI
jgi:hypothetical protein